MHGLIFTVGLQLQNNRFSVSCSSELTPKKRFTNYLSRYGRHLLQILVLLLLKNHDSYPYTISVIVSPISANNGRSPAQVRLLQLF